ncbi:hypothetical protein MMC19_000047 [Ptychographa xylographoides]|nr:hypothetical protein [Ptychographa xylographoides]
MPPRSRKSEGLSEPANPNTKSATRIEPSRTKKRTATSLVESPELAKRSRLKEEELDPQTLSPQRSKLHTARAPKSAAALDLTEPPLGLEVQPVARSKRSSGKQVNAKDSFNEKNTAPSNKKSRKVQTEPAAIETELELALETTVTSKRGGEAKKISTAVVAKEAGVTEDLEPELGPSKKKITRKTREEKAAESMPLAKRTVGLRMFVGAHVSCAKGVHNTVTNAVHIGGNSLACFLKSQRKWENPPLQDEHKTQFHSLCAEYEYEAIKHILPHGSYLVNLAQEERDKAKQAYDAFVDDLRRCESLGIKLYNFHPGNTGPKPRSEAIARIAAALNRAHKETKTVKPVLENMAGTGNVVGSTFEDLKEIIEQVEDKTRIGVCIDTCHAFAAGYDLRTPEAFKNTMDKFDKIVGMKYLSALHINDSKAPFNSHRDLHQNIGLGFLGLRAFHNVMNEPRFEDLPLVLETPIERKNEEGKTVEDKQIWATEIKLLESLIGMDPNSEAFQKLEADLAAKGADERKKLQEVHNRKQVKDRKAAEKGQTKLKWKNMKGEASEESAGGLSDISD